MHLDPSLRICLCLSPYSAYRPTLGPRRGCCVVAAFLSFFQKRIFWGPINGLANYFWRSGTNTRRNHLQLVPQYKWNPKMILRTKYTKMERKMNQNGTGSRVFHFSIVHLVWGSTCIMGPAGSMAYGVPNRIFLPRPTKFFYPPRRPKLID